MKRKIILSNMVMNLGLVVIFVVLGNNALNGGMEETLVSLIIIYGLVTVFANLIFVAKFCK